MLPTPASLLPAFCIHPPPSLFFFFLQGYIFSSLHSLNIPSGKEFNKKQVFFFNHCFLIARRKTVHNNQVHNVSFVCTLFVLCAAVTTDRENTRANIPLHTFTVQTCTTLISESSPTFAHLNAVLP